MQNHPTKFWHPLKDSRVQCDVCPRACKMQPGQRGLCFVRANEEGAVVLKTYGRSSGFCIDPIEKKPLNHFLPGSPVLSFGTAGCNLFCKFCQNWDISKSRKDDTLLAEASPQAIAQAAKEHGASSVAFTYNDPTIFLEYAIDTAIACHEQELKTVAVTAGYITAPAREEFYRHLDAANVDLKAFSESFYQKICAGSLSNVLETLVYLREHTDVWFEVTTLLVPGENDSSSEIKSLSRWIFKNLGAFTPLHFSAFHPDFKMTDKTHTPQATLIRARDIALEQGLHYVYTGNTHFAEGDTTFCNHCQAPLIIRDWYELLEYNLTPDGACSKCANPCAGVFANAPGTWGRKRLPIQV